MPVLLQLLFYYIISLETVFKVMSRSFYFIDKHYYLENGAKLTHYYTY